jgi:N-formylglutamate deformylase
MSNIQPGRYTIHEPDANLAWRAMPVVFSSPHSGREYRPDFLASARLDALTLRRSEDCYIDEIFASVPRHGGTLIAATFPRAWCDANREPWELDPAMFEDSLPPWVNTASPRVGAGLGTIARVVSNGEAIYRGRLRFADAQARVAECWQPYHAALAALIQAIRTRFGTCLLIDCHSMPAHACEDRRPIPDIVLGDAHGVACAPTVTREIEIFLQHRGYVVRRNDPYAGGYVTRHYGRPRNGVHALQIEVARRLYMDESKLERSDGFNPLQSRLDSLMQQVTSACGEILAPTKKEGGALRHRQV